VRPTTTDWQKRHLRSRLSGVQQVLRSFHLTYSLTLGKPRMESSVCNMARTVVWEDRGRNSSSYSIYVLFMLEIKDQALTKCPHSIVFSCSPSNHTFTYVKKFWKHTHDLGASFFWNVPVSFVQNTDVTSHSWNCTRTWRTETVKCSSN
jgi:hypothetical protein